MYKINELFYSIQGEGPFAGHPAVFVRFSQCNLTCDFCDTVHQPVNYVWSAKDIVDKCSALAGTCRLVVITGGEPFLQDLEPLINLFSEKGWLIQIESNGTLAPKDLSILDKVALVLSPKEKYKMVITQYADAIKFVLRAGEEPQTLVVMDALAYNIPIYIQPVDDKDDEVNRQNLLWVIQMCLKGNLRLSLQLQKILEVQ